MKTEMQKMLEGGPYDCGDPELMALCRKGKNLTQQYNGLEFGDKAGKKAILHELLGSMGQHIQIMAPFFVDYGKFIHLGDNVEINMNCVFLDCNTITIGDNVLVAPNVQIYTVFHPVSAKDRCNPQAVGDFPYAVSETAPVTIGNNCWIGGGSILLPGVTLGDNVTIGAGSVVTRAIPANSLALGNPARVVRKI